jgi:hypothetical protein
MKANMVILRVRGMVAKAISMGYPTQLKMSESCLSLLPWGLWKKDFRFEVLNFNPATDVIQIECRRPFAVWSRFDFF